MYVCVDIAAQRDVTDSAALCVRVCVHRSVLGREREIERKRERERTERK